jgi:hypothetical protein
VVRHNRPVASHNHPVAAHSRPEEGRREDPSRRRGALHQEAPLEVPIRREEHRRVALRADYRPGDPNHRGGRRRREERRHLEVPIRPEERRRGEVPTRPEERRPVEVHIRREAARGRVGLIGSCEPPFSFQSPNAYPTEGESANPELGKSASNFNSMSTPPDAPVGIMRPPPTPANAGPLLRQACNV